MTLTHRAESAASDPLWYKDAIIYELHIRAFKDSNGDGIGDFRGLIEKLDYLRDLGVTAIWLLPFYPSPLRDDGYDIADFQAVNPSFGTLRDVKAVIREARARGLRVITELVCNHTSDQHPWFQRARRAPSGSAHRDFYVWSDTPDRYSEARIIFTDTESSNWTWDPVARAYFWHRFFHHQPDLNFESEAVQRAIIKAMDFWFETGIDGLRLDAIPYLFEREGTNCENLPETHAFLKRLRAHVDARFTNRMLLAEANQWSEDAVAYFGDGDECHMSFNFPVMPRMYMALRMEDRHPIVDILENTPPIPPNTQWAIFLRNHDELTLEMVTDEERDYMYRIYAHDPQMRINVGIRRRLAPLLGNHRRRIELLNGLLFSLPGTPVIYYGDEIGMGDNPYLGDRNGVRTPMQWTADRNSGFSDANPQRMYFPLIVDPEYHYQTINVEAQQNNPHSLLWWMKRVIALRKRHSAFGRGTLTFLHPENGKVLAFLRADENETILVVANLSRFVQFVELDMSTFRGATPVELFGRTRFPQIGELPYLLTLGPHAFYWFVLEPVQADGSSDPAGDPASAIPLLTRNTAWECLGDGTDPALSRLLPNYLRARRWFGGKARTIRSARITSALPIPVDNGNVQLAFVHVEYSEGDDETYLLPLALAVGAQAEHILRDVPHAAVARLPTGDGENAVLFDAFVEPELSRALLAGLIARRNIKGRAGELIATTSLTLRDAQIDGQWLEPSVVRTEQSNSSVIYGNRYILKLFRRLQSGVNPDAEIGRFLTDRGFTHHAELTGTIEHQRAQQPPALVAVLNRFVTDSRDAWNFTLDALGAFYERFLAQGERPASAPASASALLEAASRERPAEAIDAIGPFLELASLLGRRTGELHIALASGRDADFRPEPFSTLYQRSLYQSLRAQANQSLQLMRRRLDQIPESARADAELVLHNRDNLLGRFDALLSGKISAMRTRLHGDYHLGQVLFTGEDFIILDFEGEPTRSLGERRIKRSPIRDVAGMLRSFHYAGFAAGERLRPEDADLIEGWSRVWYGWVSAAFMRAYLDATTGAAFLPQSREELRVLLDVFLLEKAFYELNYELNNRPTWVRTPLQGLLQLLS